MTPHLSHSQFRMFDDCPRRYWNVYRNPDGGREPARDNMRAGTAAENEVVFKLKSGLWDELPERWTWMRERFADADGRVPKDCFQVRTEIPLLGDYLQDGTRAPLTFVSFLDLQRGNAIVDFKRIDASKDVDGAIDETQVKTYALAVALAYGFTYVNTWYVSIKHKFHRHFAYEIEELQEHYNNLQRRADMLRLEYEFEATPGGHCAECLYRPDCPANERFKRFFATLDDAFDPNEAIEAIRWAEQIDKAARERLKNYMESEGISEIKHNGMRFYASPSIVHKVGKS